MDLQAINDDHYGLHKVRHVAASCFEKFPMTTTTYNSTLFIMMNTAANNGDHMGLNALVGGRGCTGMIVARNTDIGEKTKAKAGKPKTQ